MEQQIARILTNVQRRYQAATNPDAAAGADAAAQQGAGGAGPSGAGSSGQAAAGFSGGSKGAEQGSEDEEEEEMEVEDEDLEELKARHQLVRRPYGGRLARCLPCVSEIAAMRGLVRG